MRKTEPRQESANNGEETIDMEVGQTKESAESQKSTRLVVLGLIEEASRLVSNFIEKVKSLCRRAYSFVSNRLFKQVEDAYA